MTDKTFELALATLVGACVALLLVFFSAPPTWFGDAQVARANDQLRAVAAHRASLETEALDKRHLYLSSSPARPLPAISQTLRIGDRITVGGPDNIKRVLEVRRVQHTALALDDLMGEGSPHDAAKLTIVTARDVENPDQPLVRFIFENGDAAVESRETPRSL